jgi:hypothetical protein
LDIAAMLLWMVTAAAGVSLLAARRPARGSGDPAPDPAPAEAPAPAAVRSPAGVPPAASAALAAGAKVPPISHTRITTQPGEHPLLEFMHPALGLVGLGCWIGFVITRFRPFAWIALGVIVVTIAAGVIWYAVSARTARPARGHRRARPLVIHGAGAAATFALAIVTALAAGHF